MKSHKDLDVYNDALALFLKVHALAMILPKTETYELGSQIRRSAESVITNIVEGYGRRRYKQDFIRFLTYAHASNLETINHIEKIALIYPDRGNDWTVLLNSYTSLGMKLHRFIEYVERSWRS
jgi:four helix bundle protein